MSPLKFIYGSKKDIPNKYLEQLYQLMSYNSSERLPLPIEPFPIEFYRNYWQLENLPEEKDIQLLVFDEYNNLIGFGCAFWNIKYDNLDKASFQCYVKPEKRRLGYGSEIIKYLCTLLPDQITSLAASALEGSVGESFLKHFKSKWSFQELISAVNLEEFDSNSVKKLAADERARIKALGYDFIEIENDDFQKKIDVEQYVAMVEEIWNDMPREELEYDDDILPVERYLGMIENILKKGNKIYGYIAIEKETNIPVGLTKVFINKYQPDHAEQDDTGVIRKHRGKGLGLALKYQLLEKLLKDTKVKIWFTGNAQSNEHMLKINKILKHKELAKKNVYEFKRDELVLFKSK